MNEAKLIIRKGHRQYRQVKKYKKPKRKSKGSPMRSVLKNAIRTKIDLNFFEKSRGPKLSVIDGKSTQRRH